MKRVTNFAVGGLIGGAIEKSRGINSGLFGFFRPIYGFGCALSSKDFFYNFMLCVVLEGVGGVLFNQDNQLWDYTNDASAIGDVSIVNCLTFAALCCVYHTLEEYLGGIND